MPIDAAKIRRLRSALNIGLSDAAKRAGLKSRQHWYLIETGRATNPTIGTLERVADVLGVSAADLLVSQSAAGGMVSASVTFKVSIGAFAFLNGKQSYTRKVMIDVEAEGAWFALVFRGEDKWKGLEGAKQLWNDESGAAKRIVVAIYASETTARSDCEAVREYFRAFSFDETTRAARLTSDSAKAVARVLVAALGSAPYGAKSGNVKSYHDVVARKTATRTANVDRARKLFASDPDVIASDPTALAAILAAAGIDAPKLKKTQSVASARKLIAADPAALVAGLSAESQIALMKQLAALSAKRPRRVKKR